MLIDNRPKNGVYPPKPKPTPAPPKGKKMSRTTVECLVCFERYAIANSINTRHPSFYCSPQCERTGERIVAAHSLLRNQAEWEAQSTKEPQVPALNTLEEPTANSIGMTREEEIEETLRRR